MECPKRQNSRQILTIRRLVRLEVVAEVARLLALEANARQMREMRLGADPIAMLRL